MKEIVTIREARTNLWRLIRKTSNGQEVIIARGSKLVARLVPMSETINKRQPGSLKGKLLIEREFFEELPADDVAGWK